MYQFLILGNVEIAEKHLDNFPEYQSLILGNVAYY